MISCICKAQLVQLNFYLVGHVRDANTSNSTACVTVTRPVDSTCQCHRCGRPWPSPELRCLRCRAWRAAMIR